MQIEAWTIFTQFAISMAFDSFEAEKALLTYMALWLPALVQMENLKALYVFIRCLSWFVPPDLLLPQQRP